MVIINFVTNRFALCIEDPEISEEWFWERWIVNGPQNIQCHIYASHSSNLNWITIRFILSLVATSLLVVNNALVTFQKISCNRVTQRKTFQEPSQISNPLRDEIFQIWISHEDYVDWNFCLSTRFIRYSLL